MAKTLHEVIDSLNDENVAEVKETLKSEATALHKKNKDLYVRAKKAEGFNYDEASKKWVKPEKKETPPVEPKKPEQPSEPDYAKLAFLEQRGLTHPDDQKVVFDEAKRLNLPLTDILGMAHIKSKLGESKTQREAESGMPSGKGGKSGGSGKNSVEYWVDRKKSDGSYDTPSDPELANKVIEARVKKEESGSKFSDELYTG